MDKTDLAGQVRRIGKLIKKRKFKKALPLVDSLMARFPDELELWTAQAICYSETGRTGRALTILRKARTRFPRDHFVLYALAETLVKTEEFEEAERAYHVALEETPPGLKQERSECYNGLGVALWAQHKRDDALDMWKRAVEEDPGNKIAQRNLEQFTNEYNEPTPPSPVFDDPYHFQRIQTERYLKQVGREIFQNDKEAERVIGAIFQAWNDHVAPRSKELDTMTPAEKTELFGSITVDFTSTFASPLGKSIRSGRREHGERHRSSTPEAEEERELEALWKRFGFLPSGKAAMLLLTLGMPALMAVGVTESRVKELVERSKISDEEEELFLWAWDLLEAVMAANAEKGSNAEIESMRDAIRIAGEELNEEGAALVVQAMRRLIEELEKEARQETNRGGKKKR